MVGVGLFVPLLSYYWKDLGVRPELLGVVQSTYQLSQIASGVVIGWVGDHILGRKNVLLLSLLGSAVSYSMAAMAWQTSTIALLVCSRCTVGAPRAAPRPSLLPARNRSAQRRPARHRAGEADNDHLPRHHHRPLGQAVAHAGAHPPPQMPPPTPVLRPGRLSACRRPVRPAARPTGGE